MGRRHDIRGVRGRRSLGPDVDDRHVDTGHRSDPEPDTTAEGPSSEPEDDEPATEAPTEPESSQVVTTPGEGVIVRSSGGAHTSDTDDTRVDEAADSDDDDTDVVVIPGDDSDDSGDSGDTVAQSTTHADEPVGTASAARQMTAAQTETVAAHDVSVPKIQTAPLRLPTPNQVVHQIKETVTACVCGIINGTIKLLNAAMSAFSGGGGGAAGPAGPASPIGNPLVMAALEWARRSSARLIDAISKTPVAQFVYGIQTQVVQTIADFGNSPVGREISARLVQFLQQCADSTSLPEELERVTVVGGLTEPTDFAFLPDQTHADQTHRIFITEKSGAIKVYNPADGTVSTLTDLNAVTADGERGLVGIEIDPQFWTEGAKGYHTIYVAYTGPDNYDQLSRLTLTPGTFAVADEFVMLKSTEPANNFHHGGELKFDPQGQYLYWAVGDNTESVNAQNLGNIHGKILRLDRDGNAPSDNPYVSTPGAVKQIYATGLRNPFRFTFTPNGKLMVGDVGEGEWEELNIVTAGGNYGWPAEEGECSGCSYVNPVYAYRHTAPPAAAGSITSVLVYTGTTLPTQYRNKVFIADYSAGWIKELTFDEEFSSLISERTFDNKAGTTVKLDQAPDGSMYQLNIYPGQLSVIRPSGGNRAPTAVITASNTSDPGDSLEVQFSAENSTDPEGDTLQYRWDFGDGRTSTDANPTVQFANTNGDYTAYTVTLTVSDGEKTDTVSQRIVVGSTPPIAEIDDSLPLKYDAGDTITFSANEYLDDGEALQSSAYRWTVVFHHAEHTHPFRDNIIGTTGSITIPRTRDQLGNTFYRVTLSVTDSSGLTSTTSRDIHPNVVTLTFAANDPQAAFTVDGVRYIGSHVIEAAVVGVERTVSAPSPQPHTDGQLVFDRWSDGGAPTHTITTPDAPTTYTVTYTVVPSASAVAV